MRTRLQIFFIVLVLAGFKANPALSQHVVFSKIIPPDGKTFDFVTGITQDQEGIMWYSTKKGLYCYDGNHVTSYKNNPLNPNSIMSNLLESIYADSNGIIWIGSLGKGLDRFDPVSGIFTHYRHDPNDPASLSNDTVTAILRDKEGTLWIGTHDGLARLNPAKNDFFIYRHEPGNSTSISCNQVRKIYEDRQGNLWIGTGSPYPNDGGGPDSGGLNLLDKKAGTFTRYLHDPDNVHSLLSNKVSAIYEDDQGVLWVGTGKAGLHKMNRADGTFERLVFDPAHPEMLSGPLFDKKTSNYEHITFFIQDAAESYWFGTVDAGLFYYNPLTGKILNFHGTESSSSGFVDYGAFRAFTSRDHILWIGGTQGDIYHFDPLLKEIPHTAIQGAPVGSFYEDSHGIFWIGTDRELLKCGPDDEILKRYVIESNPGKSESYFIYSIYEDRQGNLWIGSAGGLCLFDTKTEKFTRYKNNQKDDNSLSNNNVISIFEDSQANFWIGTFRGLNLMDRKTGSFTQFFMNPLDTARFGINIATAIVEDNAGKFWISSWNGNGVYQFNRENKKFKSYLKGSSIISMHMDGDGVIWCGGSDGLYWYNREIDNFIRYTDSGSPAGISDVFSLTGDDRNYLWAGTSEGIVRINPERNETSEYGISYGIGENTLNFGSSGKRTNGKIYFGDPTGYFSFSPKELIENLKAPEIVFTGFRLADRIVKPDDGGPVKGRLSKQSEIRLSHDQDVFSFDFAVIDYSNPEENRLIYFLENYDNKWYQASSEQRAYYFNIPPGKYTFHVKAVNSYGVWAEKKIDIVILPPWWRTWWAYFIYTLLFIAVAFGIDRIQRRRILRAEKERNREKELAQAKEIEKAYTELKATQIQLIQSEKMASLGELTAGIAHEIQNPLNFVNNFSEVCVELVDEMKAELAVDSWQSAGEIAEDIKLNLEKINFHGKRADAIVKGMLQHSRTSNGVRELTDINALADEYLRLSYHGLRAKDKSFNADFKFEPDDNLPKVSVIPQDIGRVILNLINNAFYAVSDKKRLLEGDSDYKPTVVVITGKDNDRIQIRVKDNGNGIPANVKEKIFQPFFTTKPTGEGTGLGLSLSYDIIKAHGGELKVETKEGEGTEFIILLMI
jgi:ligand-binding sensor domain-containing protein/signal transduction histidine kinase